MRYHNMIHISESSSRWFRVRETFVAIYKNTFLPAWHYQQEAGRLVMISHPDISEQDGISMSWLAPF